jgi:transposase
VTIGRLIQQRITEVSVIDTDEYDIYSRLPEWGYDHCTVYHAKREYACSRCCETHASTLEGFWSLLRGWLFPHQGISHEILPLYLDFFEFMHKVRARGKSALDATIDLLIAPPCNPSCASGSRHPRTASNLRLHCESVRSAWSCSRTGVGNEGWLIAKR